ETGGGNKGVGRGRGGLPGRGSVRQSFSHGRSKAVVVETKRKRVLTPGSGGPSGAAAATTAKGAARPATSRTKAPKPDAPEKARTGTPRAEGSGAGAARGNRGPRPRMLNTLSADEAQRRLEAIRQHQKDEEVRKRREAEEERRRVEE